mmetsp:Transcript_4895/g.13354  ORF Transcript_4895/g.13354 Transcript_4895/m.13354 type:complete len:230 (-) Transcript_4895:514-1203(-)
MVHDVVRRESKAVQSTAGVHVRRHARPAVHILSDALELGSVLEVGGADGFAHDVPLVPCRGHLDLLLHQDVHELLTDLLGFAQALGVQVVPITPSCAVAIVFPLLVYMEQRQVVTLRDEELLPGGITFLSSIIRPEEHWGDRQHADNGQGLAGASHLRPSQQHLGQGRFQWELHHGSASRSQSTCVVKRAQHPELVHGVQDVFLGWWVHEAKLKQILDVQGLEQQHHIS